MTRKPLYARGGRLPLVALLLAVSVGVFAQGSGGDGDGHNDGHDDGKPIPREQFIKDANAQFDTMANRYPNFTSRIDKTKQVFNANAGDLKKDTYSGWEKNYITESLNNQLKAMGQQLQIIDRCRREGCSSDQQVRMLDASKADAIKAQTATDNKALVAMTASKQGLDGGGGGGAQQAPDQSNGTGVDAAKTSWKDHNGGGHGILDSDLVSLQTRAIKEGFRDPASKPGGNVQPGGAEGSADPGSGGSGGSGGTAATPNGAGGANTGSGGGTLAENIGSLMNSGAAQTLAEQSGNELDKGQYSQAIQDSKNALMLDPTNQQATAVSHFAQGRSDGIVSDGPASAKAAGGIGGADVGAGSGGGFGAGGGFAGSASPRDGLATGGAAERTGAAGSLALARGGPSGAALAGMTGAQAQSAAQSALGMRDYAGAMAFVNRALAQDPKNASLLGLRSSIYAQQRDYVRAAADAKSGLELAPKDPALLRALGFAQLRDKDYNGAMATANMMLELNPNDPYAYAIRGHAYGSLGDRDAMLADLKRAAELDPSFREAAAQMAGQLQLPSDKDILFLFPGEEGAASTKTAAPAGGGRSRLFGLLVGASALGGLLLALVLLNTVLAPLKAQVSSAFTRITRTGPTLGAEIENSDTAEPASVNGLVPGLIRGQYEISRQIGQGGMGTVFEGTDRSLGRRVAIKKMREELRVNPQERARFVIEAKTVAALHHPNIVDIYAIAEEGPDVYLVFEYVDGKTVHEIIQSSGRVSIEAAAKIVRASADALGYAHSRGVIHRDMKPSNVMIDGAGRVKVMDFGIARMAKDSMTRFSMTNTVVGTPPYMAPEQEQGQVRRESDVYSLAVCAYEMLTGKLPFIGIGAGMLMNKINGSFVAPSRATAGLPDALDAVFAKAFQADPEQRYRTPQEFADALEAALPAGVRA